LRKYSKENLKSLTTKSSSAWYNPRMPWEDISFALAGLPHIISKYARLKYANQQYHFSEIWRYVYWQVEKMSEEQGWQPRNKKPYSGRRDPFLSRLAYLALLESAGSDKCNKCNGRGTIHTGYKVMDCFRCNGSGRMQRTELGRAKFMNIHKTNWHKRWQRRFNYDILGIFDVFEYEITKELRERL
jgi:hypothetical protein